MKLREIIADFIGAVCIIALPVMLIWIGRGLGY